VGVELIVLDVDGCLSDGKIFYSESGEELKAFSVKDGLGISSWVKLGKKVAIITGRKSKIVEKRAKELGIEFCRQGIKDKKGELQKIIDELGIGFESVAGVGDDFNDYQMLQSVGLSFTPADGVESIKEIVDITLTKKGGDGAVREMIDIIVKREGLFESFKELWLAK
jgi:3-deoxy-D-manno-octulosonate 8-phosphate phosphatase (KDO 8-P phosphatase)